MGSPRRELKDGSQVVEWLHEWGRLLKSEGLVILIGSGSLLWHAHEKDIHKPLPENSMDVDAITESDEVAALGYNALIGSEFELKHGWHVNLMPKSVLKEMPQNWENRAQRKKYGKLTVMIPSAEDLMVPKLKRGEPRDCKHAEWARQAGLLK